MIKITLNEPDFEYDIHSLVKAFFPAQQVVIDTENPQNPGSFSKNGYGGRHPSEEKTDLYLKVDYTGDCITVYAGAHKNEYTIRDETRVCYTDREDTAQRTDTKNRLKRLLYRMLSGYTGKTLPWGTLTGIRPTKIPMKGLEEGKTEEEILDGMRRTYLTSSEKASLALEIARKERGILQEIDYRGGYSLYIGIPFCPTRCLYCSFTSYPIAKWEKRTGEYLDALEKEAAGCVPLFAGKKLQTVYIGGGTPTSLSPRELDRLLTMVEDYFDLSQVREFTVEGGRPDSFTPEKLSVLRAHPVTRISVNPQTMNQETLDLIGRSHTAEQTVEAFAMAREAGFDNINMDLILGLPGENPDMVRHTLAEIGKLRPDSLTVHSLALKRAARLREEFAHYAVYGMENSDEQMNLVRAAAADMGLFPYYLYRQKNMAGNLENVGYAAPGKEGLYNILIMEEKQTILSLGAAGMTKIVTDGRPVRRENVKDVDQYITRIDEMIERKKNVCQE